MNFRKDIAECLCDVVVNLIKCHEAQPRSLTAQSMTPVEPYKTHNTFLMLLWNYSLNKNIVPLKGIRKASENCVKDYITQQAIVQRGESFVLGLPVIFGANLIGHYVAWETGYQSNADIIGLATSLSVFVTLVPVLRRLNAQTDSARTDLKDKILQLPEKEWKQNFEMGLFLADKYLAGKLKEQYLPKGYVFDAERTEKSF